MTRRRWVYVGEEAIEVGADYIPVPRDAAATAGILWNDRAYQDMQDPRFASRTQHREFMKINNLATVDDFSNTWKRTEKARIDSRHGIDPRRRQNIGEAVQRVANGYKPQLLKE